MELGLSLGDASKSFRFIDNKPPDVNNKTSLGFCMDLSISPNQQQQEEDQDNISTDTITNIRKSPTHHHHHKTPSFTSIDPPIIQLDLLPNTPVVPARNHRHHHALPWLPSDNGLICEAKARGVLDVNRVPSVVAAVAPVEDSDDHDQDQAAEISSSPPNSAASSFQMDFCIYSTSSNNRGGNTTNNNHEADQMDRTSSRASDEDDNGSARKKLRLSKEQSAFLEESFKEHNTLNPKQKLALAKQLNLRPRQVEVWFQNRRARTKLKQTEVDYEYLKRCCETLTEENRRLHKELQELRALKTSNPFYMQLPATTLTMCPSCERVATTTTAATNASNNTNTNTNEATTSTSTSKATATGPSLARPGLFYPFSHHKTHQSSAAS